MFHNKLDRGVLELLGVVEVGQDQALQAGVHCKVITKRLLKSMNIVTFGCFNRDFDLPRIFLSIQTIGTCLQLLTAVETLC